MFARNKKAIVSLAHKLRSLQANPNDSASLLSLQQELGRRIRACEARVALLRDTSKGLRRQLRVGRLARAEAHIVRKKLEACERRIDLYRHLKYIWRCFGDGIAFAYLDKHALKHMFYRTDVYEPKQDSGSLGGKIGFRREWAVMRGLVLSGVPALLCDLTNVLRHGDVCILVGPDPMPLEIKSGKNTNERAARQIDSIKKLVRFFASDEARDFRGLPHIARIEFNPEEVTRTGALNRCISEAEDGRPGIATPELGLHYLCVRDESSLDKAFVELGSLKHAIVSTLNEAKAEEAWGFYYPFTLSIDDPTRLYEFLVDEYILAVVLDQGELIRQFTARSFDVAMPTTGSWALWLRSPTGVVSAVSHAFFGRLFYEFQSLSWFVAAQVSVMDKIAANTDESRRHAGIMDADVGKIEDLPEWVQAAFRDHKPAQ